MMSIECNVIIGVINRSMWLFAYMKSHTP